MTGHVPLDSRPRLTVVGTGAFATSLVSALVADGRGPAHVTVVGRTRAATSRALRTVLARAGGAPAVSLHSCTVPLGLDGDLTPVLAALRPDLVVVCASLHSPYPPADRDDAWTALVAECEFGLTGLLQAPLAVQAARAAAENGGPPVVNACYPDFVNPLLTALDLPVLCGLGNVHTLATGLALRLPAPPQGMHRVLAHHRHLKKGVPTGEDARTWWPGTSAHQVTAALDDLRDLPRRELNDLGARAGGRLVAALLGNAVTRTSLPGPAGLPGGYPVRAGIDGCVLDLPDELTVDEATGWNQRHALAEGIRVRDGRIEVSGRTGRALQRLGVVPAESIDVDGWHDAARRLLHVRDVMSRQPPPL